MSRAFRLWTFVAIVVGVALIGASPMARADVIDNVTMNFNSGATFTGTVTFASDYSSVTGVSGTLTDYQFGATGYQGSGSDAISWIWYPGTNFASGAGNFGNLLMDGTSVNYWNWIAFTYNYSGAPTLAFAAVGYGNAVDYVDPMISGSIGPATATPEPCTLLLLGSFLGLGGLLRRRE